MKKTQVITLVLIAAELAACSKPKREESSKMFIRSDTTAAYTHTTHSYHGWYYAFRPYGFYDHGSYHRSGFYSSGISERSNIGHNSTKSSAIRGGFGGRSMSVSS